jgi:hypothetical protein
LVGLEISKAKTIIEHKGCQPVISACSKASAVMPAL